MSHAVNPNLNLSAKIARLIQEKGFNQEDFANISQLNRQTVRQILQPDNDRSLRNSTVAACAKALGLTVSDLRTLPLDRLIARLSSRTPLNGDDAAHHLLHRATQPELRSWIERNPQRSQELRPDEIEELLALQDSHALTAIGVEHFVAQIERRRELIDQVRTIAHTEYLDLLEQLVGLMYDKIQPRDSI